ncbi:pannexin-1-like [Denticeps clupeoides]|uniref:Pannexin n=1 Tax=Denticeps clupeoides TaxID=299321 RepID=A0AAY4D0W8_9TELE|nr:pannexin-1 [Denticeps clupeoides]
MAIAHVATEFVFSDFVLKDPPDAARYRTVRLELSLDKLTSCVAVALPLVLISLAFAQEVSVGTQISCFSPSNFSWRQAMYVDSFCWAAVQTQHLTSGDVAGLPLWLHKFFPYVLLLVAVCVYSPALLWRLLAAPALFSDLTFILQELDRCYNRAINLASKVVTSDTYGSVPDLSDRFKYPLVEQYLMTKRLSCSMLVFYLICRSLTLLFLILACLYLGYYIRLASLADEFACSINTGILQNDTSFPPSFQCKLVAVGVFQLLSYINLGVYVALVPACVYAALVPMRQSQDFLRPYQLLPTLGVLDFSRRAWDDLGLYLLFLQENLTELKSYKCLKVLEMLKERDDGCDTMLLLQTLGQVKTDTVDGNLAPSSTFSGKKAQNGTEMKEMSPLLQTGDAANSHYLS